MKEIEMCEVTGEMQHRMKDKVREGNREKTKGRWEERKGNGKKHEILEEAFIRK